MNEIDLFLYINLADRTDRNKDMLDVLLNQLKLPQNKVERVEAIRKSHGFTGCTDSHLKAVNLAIASGVRNVCIFEDDFMLVESPKDFNRRVSEAWKEIKNEYDVMFLAMTPIQLEKTNIFGFHRVIAGLAMPAFIVSRTYLPKLKAIYEIALKEKKPHDMITQRFQPGNKWFGFYPVIARQRPGFSDIEKRFTDYGYLDVKGSMLKDRTDIFRDNTSTGSRSMNTQSDNRRSDNNSKTENMLGSESNKNKKIHIDLLFGSLHLNLGEKN